MDFDIRWLVENHIIYVVMITPPQTTTEQQALDQQLLEYGGLCLPNKAHYLVDVRRATASPSIQLMHQMQFLRQSHMGCIVLLAYLGALQRLVARIVTTVVGINHYQTLDLDDALAYIYRQDSSIPVLLDVGNLPER